MHDKGKLLVGAREEQESPDLSGDAGHRQSTACLAGSRVGVQHDP